MAVGDVDELLYPTRVEYVNAYGKYLYGVKLQQVYIEGKSLDVKQHDLARVYGSGTIIDFGATLVHVATGLYTNFGMRLRSFAKSGSL